MVYVEISGVLTLTNYRIVKGVVSFHKSLAFSSEGRRYFFYISPKYESFLYLGIWNNFLSRFKQIYRIIRDTKIKRRISYEIAKLVEDFSPLFDYSFSRLFDYNFFISFTGYENSYNYLAIQKVDSIYRNN